MGHAGQMCRTCRHRHLKCDEVKPICLRCQKSRRLCVYPWENEKSLLVHSENTFAAGRVKRPRGPRSSLMVVLPPLDLETRALNFYFANYLMAVENIPIMVRDLSECISVWTVSGANCPMVNLAISAMALAIFARTQNLPTAAIEAVQCYNRILESFRSKLARISLPSPDEQLNDACFLTAIIMARYEDVTLRQPSILQEQIQTRQSLVHHRGTMSMLHTWQMSAKHTHPSFIVKQTRRGLLRFCLLEKLPVPEWMMDGSCFGEEDLELQYDRIFVSITNFQHTVAARTLRSVTEAEGLLNTAQELDDALDVWVDQIPRECLRQQNMIPPDVACGSLPNTDFYSAIIYNYPKPEFAASWIQFFTLRMIVSSVVMNITKVVSPWTLPSDTFKRREAEVRRTLQTNADLVTSSVPFVLGKFEGTNVNGSHSRTDTDSRKLAGVRPHLASMLVWPLRIATNITQLRLAQRQWFATQLVKLGKIIGDTSVVYGDSELCSG